MNGERLQLPIEGMTCASCANRIEKRLNELEGVEASVNYATEAASVEYDPGRVGPDQLIEAIEAAGYRAASPSADPAKPAELARDAALVLLRRRMLFAGALALPVVLLAMIPPLQFDNWQWLSLQLATPVVLWAGWPFHIAAWRNLKRGEATMDTLISVGTLAAWGWSLFALFLGEAGQTGMTMQFELLPDRGGGTDEIYLEVAAVVTAFISPAVTSRHARSAAPGRRFKLCSSWGPRTLAVSYTHLTLPTICSV